MPDYVEARLLYDRGHLAEAWPFFESAIARSGEMANLAPIPELHYYAGDTLGRLRRYAEAEAAFLEELTHYPRNSRARLALVGIYRKTGRTTEAVRELEALVRISPTPDLYRQAAGILDALGDARHAAATRAEARRLFGEPRPAAQD
jgi:tetratricopeptide (TPR) repeat protein